MPNRTERQQATDALTRAYFLELIAGIYADQDYDDSSDSSKSSSDSSDSESSSSDSETESESELYGSETRNMYLDLLGQLHSHRYLNGRDNTVEKTNINLRMLLDQYKTTHPSIFRSYFHVTPTTFDAIVAAIQDDPIFHNSSNRPQAPVPDQLAVTLYRFGHYGNAVSQQKIALWAGIGSGTVSLYTCRVMAACCSERFRSSCVHWPDDTERERAKEWVEKESCLAWRDGWCMIDGTLVPLFMQPGLYRNVWFDCKSDYSMNVQVRAILSSCWFFSSDDSTYLHQIVSTPDLWIIDYSTGLPGSQHDATAWEETHVP